MSIVMIVLGIAAIAALVLFDLAAIRRDGYGTTPQPRSHEPWDVHEKWDRAWDAFGIEPRRYRF